MTFTDKAPVLSLHQPWAQLCFTPANTRRCSTGCGNCVDRMVKRIETRSWRTKHRGRLWIAATARPPFRSKSTDREIRSSGLHSVGDWRPYLIDGHHHVVLDRGDFHEVATPLGAIIGSVEIVDCLPITTPEWRPSEPEGSNIYRPGRRRARPAVPHRRHRR
mgnify:FL=1